MRFALSTRFAMLHETSSGQNSQRYNCSLGALDQSPAVVETPILSTLLQNAFQNCIPQSRTQMTPLIFWERNI
jgi:hypothetical protein